MSGLQKKQINKIIADRVKYWAFSFKDAKNFKDGKILELENFEEPTDDDKSKIRDFQQSIIHNTVVTGGAIASMLLGEEVNDLDIYFKDREIAKKVAHYYINTMKEKLGTTDQVSRVEVMDNTTGGVDIVIKSMGVVSDDSGGTGDYDYFEGRTENDVNEFFNKYKKVAGKNDEGPKHAVSFISSNAITLKNDIQIILRFCGDPSEIHKNFDFAHCTNYWTSHTGTVYNEEALSALLERRLYYIGSRYPVASLFRIRKFVERGYRISGGEILKIAYDVSKLDLDEAHTLKDQLCGMDLAFFSQVISMLNNREPGTTIDRTYLFSVVDRVFKLGETDND